MERLTPEQGGRPISRANQRGTRSERATLTLLAAGPVGEDGSHHALYEINLPAGTSLPGELPYGSVAVVVQSGEVVATSGGEIAQTIEPLTRTLEEAQEPMPPRERPVLPVETIPAGKDTLLRRGQAITVTGNDLMIRNDGAEAARLLLSAVLDARVMDIDRCWICPRPWEPSP